MSNERPIEFEDAHDRREHRRRRVRRHGRRAYIRSVYFMPTLATLGNAICGFGAIYVAAFDSNATSSDPWTKFFIDYHFVASAYLIFLAMIFDALDGRLARWARHTTDFGGQLDSLADVISFGCAPAFLALQFLGHEFPYMTHGVSRSLWAVGAIFMACAALRLARFNVSNEHGEQHHFSFLGMPSPGAGGVIAGYILMHHELADVPFLGRGLEFLFPPVLLLAGLLMISNIRYPHFVNRWLRGRRPLWMIIPILLVVPLILWKHRIFIGLGTLAYMLYGLGLYLYPRTRNAAWGPPAPAATRATPETPSPQN